MNHSDLRALQILNTAPEGLDSLVVYGACAAVANTGQRRDEEKSLGAPEKALLQARRDIFSGEWAKSEILLKNFRSTNPLLLGDRYFLAGLICYRRDNNVQKAEENFLKASEVFKKAGLSYRQIRSDINRFILKRDLGEYVGGALYALEQESVRRGYFDMAASISRGRAVERCVKGDFERALAPCRRSEKYYALDGCPEDQAVSQALRSIIYYQLGKTRMAQLTRKKIQLDGGQRLESYFSILDALDQGELPRVSSNHPLAKMLWKTSANKKLRPNSCYGKIVRILEKGPADKHAIMREIWGEQAGGDVYENRLRVALATLRKKQKLNIEFDGNAYFLPR